MTADGYDMTHMPYIRLMMCLMLALCVGVYGCPSESSNNGDLDAGEDVVTDVDDGDTEQGDADDAEDTEEDVSACDPACEGELDRCKESTGECVECFTEAECDGQDVCTADGRCAECGGDADCDDEYCALTDDADPDNNECVPCIEDDNCTDGVCIEGDTVGENACQECRDNDQCDDPTSSVCGSDNTCVSCSGNDGCSHLEDTSICDTSGGDGVCVECVTDSDCSGDVCSQVDNTCTSETPGSAEVCEPCVSDSQCEANHHCVPMNFAGSAHGNYCLQLESAGCGQPYSVGENKTSVGGVDALFCTLNEDLTTCEALADLKAGAENQCDPSATDINAECGDPSLGDGLCRKVGVLDNKCTYECEVDSDCPDLTNRNTCIEFDGGPDFCGG
jgi:hypothetical protein